MRRYDVGSRSPGVLNVTSEGLLFGRICTCSCHQRISVPKLLVVGISTDMEMVCKK